MGKMQKGTCYAFASRCLSCGEEGHFIRIISRRIIICFLCNQVGHVKYEYPL